MQINAIGIVLQGLLAQGFLFLFLARRYCQRFFWPGTILPVISIGFSLTLVLRNRVRYCALFEPGAPWLVTTFNSDLILLLSLSAVFL